MRTFLLFICCTALANGVSAQETRGVQPVGAKTAAAPTGVTYAVVVGISDYQDPKITDLKYAHRDAQAFAEFLRSPAGGSLPEKNLTVLLNEKATSGEVGAAFDALLEKVVENDRVVIYFSGHGDVERKTISQPGFLLCWNSPARVYMGNGGTYALAFLEEIITTLSVQNKARVLMITDACHAGKLAGSSIGGTAITGANLARQFSGETKILSCQPNELSLEGSQWGGGRGIFSYHLIDGLYGLADRNGDGWVTVSEIDRYLEDHVTPEAEPQSQVPILIGDKTEHLARVDPRALEQIQQRKATESPVLSAVDTRGLEEQVLARADSSIRADYEAFLKALAQKRFFEPASNGGPTADALYARLSAAPELADLHGFLKRNYAAALQDEAQVAINDYLSADPRDLRKRWMFDHRYDPYPRYLARAAELLGPRHYLYASLKVREHYFEGLNLRLRAEQQANDNNLFQQAIALQEQCLQIDTNATFAYNELGLLYLRLGAFARAADFFKKATECSPHWVLPWANLCKVYVEMNQMEAAVQTGEWALLLDTSYAMSHYNLAWAYHLSQKLPLARQHYEAAVRLDSAYDRAYFNLGLVHYRENNFTAAEQAWLAYSRLQPQDPGVYQNLMFAKVEQGQPEAALGYLEKALANGYRNLDELNSDAQLA
ncbi:MAG: caspase family protein, partial [Saprospiraceae bacterium]|nr:caspase family protein [Saprospiraceae bacterium]